MNARNQSNTNMIPASVVKGGAKINRDNSGGGEW